MKVTGPLMSQFAAGTIGKQLIFRSTPRGTVAYPHFRPKQPGSIGQVNHQSLFGLLADRWNYLTQEQRDYFLPTASHLHISSYNAYLAMNLARLNPAQPEGLIGWWPGIVPAGDVLHDLTANRKDGDFVSLDPNLAWPVDPTRGGRVIEYDGTGYVDVPSPRSSVDAYTWAFWFKQNAYTGGSAIVDTGWVAHYVHARFSAQKATHRLRIVTAVSAPMFLTDFTWHHYAGTFTGTTIEIHIDGILHQLVPAAVAPTANAYMRFGAHNIGVTHVGFRGRVDDLRFYNRSLSGPDIAELAAWSPL